MGEFIEQEEGLDKPKVFTNEFLTKAVKDSMAAGDIPVDHKLVIFGIVDERGARAVVTLNIAEKKILNGRLEMNIKVQGVVEHDWTGENKAGAQLLFSVR